jgi:4-amino-4-deoxy-L-arabinose transferase-like glycosyltransferase
MKSKSLQPSLWSQAKHYLLPVCVALIFLLFTFFYYPFREKLQFDTDEGLNLMRSMLVALGYPLYSQVSSDQPPLFNNILALVFRVGGPDVYRARLLVLLFSTVLVWAGAQFLQITSGRWAVILFLPLIIMVPRYLNLSVAVMIGVPSIAMAVVSLMLLAMWHQRRSTIWLILSALLLGLSVLIKLFTGFLVPIFLAGMVISEYLKRRKGTISWRVVEPALVWGVSFVVVVALLGLGMVGLRNAWFIIFPPLSAPSQDVFQSDHFSLNLHLRDALPMLLLGLLGTGIALYRRRWVLLYPLAWAAVAYVMLSFYSPVFYHHQLLITVPMALMAAAGTGEAVSALLAPGLSSGPLGLRWALGIAALAGFLWVSAIYRPVLDKELLNGPSLGDSELQATAGKLRVLNLMNEYIDQTNWIVTDVPMFAFRVGRPVPPVLATFSSKRLATGSLTEEDILTAMREYQPEQVLMARFEIPALEAYLQEHYTLVLSPEFYRLFLRNDLVGGDMPDP